MAKVITGLTLKTFAKHLSQWASVITGLTLKTFFKHLTSEGFSMLPVVY